MKNIIKILTALAAVAGAIYIIATYGEQIVATMAALEIFLGAVLQVSNSKYKKTNA